jgi:hypothetical protein
MNLPPSDFWVKVAAGIAVGIIALVLERADAIIAAKHAQKQGNDDPAPWYERKVVYAVAGVWIAVLIYAGADFVRWRSDESRVAMSASDAELNRQQPLRAENGQKQFPDSRISFDSHPQTLAYSRQVLNHRGLEIGPIAEVPTITPNESREHSTLAVPSVPKEVRVVRDESDFALVADRLANRRPLSAEDEARKPRRSMPNAAFRPKSASLTICVDPNDSRLKDWYKETTQAVQTALTRGHAGTGSGSIFLSDSGKWEFSPDSSKHGEATVEFRNGRLVSVCFDDQSALVMPSKGHVNSWAAKGPGLRFGFRSREGDEAWFETMVDSNKKDTSFVASLYPDEKRIELRVCCKLAVNSSYSDVGIDELDGGTLTIATPLEFWAKRPVSLDAKNSFAMSAADASAVLMAINRADRGFTVRRDELGWRQVTLPLRKDDFKPIRP